MNAETIRAILGLSADTVPDSALNAALELATDWCRIRSAAWRVTPPDSAVAIMTFYFLRQHMDLAGIKPSTLTLPDITMATDVNAACAALERLAVDEIKAASYAKGSVGFKQIRSGKVARWRS